MLRRFLVTVVVLGLTLGMMGRSASAQTITFGPLSGANGAAYSGHSEAGFTVATTGGSWFEAHVFGNPTPSIFAGPIGSPSTSSIQVTKDGGGLFDFTSVDLSPNNGPIEYKIEGLAGGSSVFTQSGTMSHVGFFFETLLSTSSALIDTLSITLVPGAGTTSMNIDNIVLSEHPTVPEPAFVQLSALLGLGGLGLLRLRRKA